MVSNFNLFDLVEFSGQRIRPRDRRGRALLHCFTLSGVLRVNRLALRDGLLRRLVGIHGLVALLFGLMCGLPGIIQAAIQNPNLSACEYQHAGKDARQIFHALRKFVSGRAQINDEPRNPVINPVRRVGRLVQQEQRLAAILRGQRRFEASGQAPHL